MQKIKSVISKLTDVFTTFGVEYPVKYQDEYGFSIDCDDGIPCKITFDWTEFGINFDIIYEEEDHED